MPAGVIGQEPFTIHWRAVRSLSGVRVDDRFSTIAHDPLQRLIRVHRESLADAMRHRQTSETAPASREADGGHCRLVVNALRRQIGRLERTLAAEMLDRLTMAADGPPPADDDLSEPPDRTACCPPYAPRQPVATRHELPPPEPRPPAPVILPLLTTNTGGLIDLLA